MRRPPQTVAELIELLQQYPADMPVLVEGYETGFDLVHSLVIEQIQQVRQPEGHDGQAQKIEDIDYVPQSGIGAGWDLEKYPAGEPFSALVILGERETRRR
ncbi:hypothetical protein N7645_15180 [Pseudomonas juntendi]|uniref:hypothetical protein n=1 Tax=Pseudomonas TaxID=286 RepID=UPI0015B515B7|nr:MULTISPECIES: hypothetical protein [Pseudomonas]MDG9918231.1 hypothetical protein [Pseudomonas juntendi]MDH0507679.1 hypothetical protein [Pseudomonas juntendi]MDH1044839.1 hypothetical protein [Pseudomonas juntendi]